MDRAMCHFIQRVKVFEIKKGSPSCLFFIEIN